MSPLHQEKALADLQKRAEERAAIIEKEAAYILEALDATPGDFARSVARELRAFGRIPMGRGFLLTLSIVARYHHEKTPEIDHSAKARAELLRLRETLPRVGSAND